jgi:hypothetical protein
MPDRLVDEFAALTRFRNLTKILDCRFGQDDIDAACHGHSIHIIYTPAIVRQLYLREGWPLAVVSIAEKL